MLQAAARGRLKNSQVTFGQLRGVQQMANIELGADRVLGRGLDSRIIFTDSPDKRPRRPES